MNDKFQVTKLPDNMIKYPNTSQEAIDWINKFINLDDGFENWGIIDTMLEEAYSELFDENRNEKWIYAEYDFYEFSKGFGHFRVGCTCYIDSDYEKCAISICYELIKENTIYGMIEKFESIGCNVEMSGNRIIILHNQDNIDNYLYLDKNNTPNTLRRLHKVWDEKAPAIIEYNKLIARAKSLAEYRLQRDKINEQKRKDIEAKDVWIAKCRQEDIDTRYMLKDWVLIQTINDDGTIAESVVHMDDC